MIRSLVVVAIGGTIISVLSLAGANMHHHVRWHVPGTHLRIDRGDDDHDGGTLHLSGTEKTITRNLPWTGAEKLTISVPAKVTYVQGPVAAITVTGPDTLVDHVRLAGDTLSLDTSSDDDDIETHHGIQIAITAPNLHSFALESAQSLDIAKLATDHLDITIEGAGKVVAAGTARSVKLDISGAGDAQLGNLTVTDADIEIDGFGNVVAGPTGSARVQINGAGNVVLTHRPTTLTQNINGGGHISQPDAPAEQKL